MVADSEVACVVCVDGGFLERHWEANGGLSDGGEVRRLFPVAPVTCGEAKKG